MMEGINPRHRNMMEQAYAEAGAALDEYARMITDPERYRQQGLNVDDISDEEMFMGLLTAVNEMTSGSDKNHASAMVLAAAALTRVVRPPKSYDLPPLDTELS